MLQVRPMASGRREEPVDLDALPADRVLVAKERALGHGVIDDILDVVYVDPVDLDGTMTKSIAHAIGEANARLVEAGRPYLLLGPGRFGTADPTLGVPVQWAHIEEQGGEGRVRHFSPPRPIEVHADGRRGHAKIAPEARR